MTVDKLLYALFAEVCVVFFATPDEPVITTLSPPHHFRWLTPGGTHFYFWYYPRYLAWSDHRSSPAVSRRSAVQAAKHDLSGHFLVHHIHLVLEDEVLRIPLSRLPI